MLADKEKIFLKSFLDAYWNDPGLAFWRAKEAVLINKVRFLPRMLDLGCADGIFLNNYLKSAQIDIHDIFGVDLRYDVLAYTKGLNLYKYIVSADIARLPFKDNVFNTILSNCVLEHIDSLQQAITDVGRVAAKGASFIITVPDENFGDNLPFVKLAKFFRLNKLAKKIKDKTNNELMHFTCQNKDWWESRLNSCGFKIKMCQPYLTNKELFLWSLLFYSARFKMGRFNLAGIFKYSADHGGKLVDGFLKSAIKFISFWLVYFFIDNVSAGGNALFIVAKKE